MNQGQVSSSPPHITRLLQDSNPEACTSLALMQTKASPVTVMDALSLWRGDTEQAGVRPSHHPPSAAAPAIHPSPYSFPLSPPCSRLTYRPTCLASPRLRNHYDALGEWLWTGQDFRGGKEAERKRAPRWTDGQRGGIFRVVKRVTIDLIICII